MSRKIEIKIAPSGLTVVSIDGMMSNDDVLTALAATTSMFLKATEESAFACQSFTKKFELMMESEGMPEITNEKPYFPKSIKKLRKL